MSTLLVLSGLQDKGALQAHALKRYDNSRLVLENS